MINAVSGTWPFLSFFTVYSSTETFFQIFIWYVQDLSYVYSGPGVLFFFPLPIGEQKLSCSSNQWGGRNAHAHEWKIRSMSCINSAELIAFFTHCMLTQFILSAWLSVGDCAFCLPCSCFLDLVTSAPSGYYWWSVPAPEDGLVIISYIYANLL